MESLTGCTRDELIGAPFKNHFTDPDRADDGIMLVLMKKKVTTYELTARDRNGKETVVSYNATTFYDRDRKLQGVFATARDITKRKLAEKQILELALYDSLTRLPNRRLLTERLGQIMSMSQRSGRYCALMFLDLDNFKPINDVYGHSMGDLLLIEVARRLGGCIRGVDVVARFGGDEFVVVLSEIGANTAEATTQSQLMAEKLRTTLDKPYMLAYPQKDNTNRSVLHNCTASICVVVFFDNMSNQDEIMKWADAAMYTAVKVKQDSISLCCDIGFFQRSKAFCHCYPLSPSEANLQPMFPKSDMNQTDTVALHPVPRFTQFFRQAPATQVGMLDDEAADKVDVLGCDRAVTVAQCGGWHQPERTSYWRRTQAENEYNRFDQPYYTKLISNSSRLAGRTRYGALPKKGGNWRQVMLAEVGTSLPMERVHFLGGLAYDDYLRVLQISRCHVYLTYPFVLSWSCLVAMSAERVVVAGNTGPVQEVITHGVNGLLHYFFDVGALSSQVIDVLATPEAYRDLGTQARQTVLEKYDLKTKCLPELIELVTSIQDISAA